MSHPEHSLREKTKLAAVDTDRLAVLEERLAALEASGRSPQLAEVENYARILRSIQTMIAANGAQLVEQAAWMQWYAQAGTAMRKLFEDVMPAPEPELPDFAETMAKAAASASGNPATPTPSGAPAGLPPEIAAMLKTMNITIPG